MYRVEEGAEHETPTVKIYSCIIFKRTEYTKRGLNMMMMTCYNLRVISCHYTDRFLILFKLKKLNSVAWVRERTIPSDCRLSAKWLPTFADRGCHVVSATDPYGRIVGFLDRSCYFFYQVAPQLYSRGWVDPVPDPLLLRRCGSAGNRTRVSGSVAKNSDHYIIEAIILIRLRFLFWKIRLRFLWDYHAVYSPPPPLTFELNIGPISWHLSPSDRRTA
jgi:hypothetical protein